MITNEVNLPTAAAMPPVLTAIEPKAIEPEHD
jgi:hypothetical protein